jgi:hypothetical protein
VHQAHSQEVGYTVCYQRGKHSCDGYQEVARSNDEVMEMALVEYEIDSETDRVGGLIFGPPVISTESGNSEIG